MHWKKAYIALSLILSFSVVLAGIGYYAGRRRPVVGNTGAATVESLDKLRVKNRALRRKLESLSPSGVYIVVDTANNLLFIMKGKKILRKAVVSTGSGNVLKKPGSQTQWVFDTPRGEFAVLTKSTGPVWTRPDWAFIEEGEKVPAKWKDRIEEGVLGEYALGIGNGYFIHGTLYTRMLGRNVTHGCVRMEDADLKAVFDSARLGTKIFIF